MSNGLQDKLYNYEAMPPSNSWEKIAAALDEAEMKADFPNRLYKMEATPRPAVWESINHSLGNAMEEEIPARRRIMPIFRYAAAAVLVGIIAFGIVKLTTANKNKETAIIDKTAAKDTQDHIVKGIATPPVEDATVNATTANEEDAALEENKKMVAKLDRPRNHAKASDNRNNPSDYNANQLDDVSQAIYAYDDHVPDMADRYITLMTPDGNFIRMAKKWSSLLCCVSGEEQDPDCKDQLKKWQEKIATAPIAPSPGNFLDILDLVNSLSDGSKL